MEAEAPSAAARIPNRRRRAAGFLFALVTVAVLAAGGWGLFASLATESPPARVGEAIRVPQGFLRVDRVAPESMAPMSAKMGRAAASGMSMSSMGMDMAPDGQRRFIVDVTLAAERGDLSYSPEDFRISGKGMKEAGPIRHQLDAGTVSAGSAVSGSLLFQAPEKASGLMLGFGDGGRKVALDLKPATQSDGHSHGGGPSKGGGHLDSHNH